MCYEKFNINEFQQLLDLMQKYKESISEPILDSNQVNALKLAAAYNKIEFYIAKEHDKLIAMCSVCITFSTFDCCLSGVFEDFFILPEHRGKGIARGLTQYVFDELKSRDITTLWVGCADADLEMYKSLGFDIPLGNLLTWSV